MPAGNIASLAIARRTNRLKDLSNAKPDNGIFPGIQHFPAPNAMTARVSLPYYSHGPLLESIYTEHGPILSASPEDLRMNLGFRQGNGAGGNVSKNGLSGVGEAGSAWLVGVQSWPNDRSAGLTYGEIQTINAWLRDLGVPGLTDNNARNARGMLPRDAVAHIWTKWQNLTLANRAQMAEACRMHLTMYGFDTKRGQSAYWMGFDIRWPLSRTGQSGINSKIGGMGTDAWLRYVAAMAIGRDLFAEELEQVGGIEPGMTDTLADTQLTGDAVAGEWQNLAGVWRWKGVDVLGRPLNESKPLFAKPMTPPSEIDTARARNTQFFMKFFSYPTVAANVGPTLTSAIPALLGAYRNVIAPRTNASPIADVPRTIQGYAALMAALFNVLGIDIKAALGATYDQAMAILSGPTAEAPASPAMCPQVYAPVVGKNGQTYGNACEAEAAGQLAPVTAQDIAGVGGVGNLLPSGPWQDTALKIATTAQEILQGSVNKAKAAEAPAPTPAPVVAVTPQYAPAPQASNGGLMLVGVALAALLVMR
jgi:hypothetical protein